MRVRDERGTRDERTKRRQAMAVRRERKRKRGLFEEREDSLLVYLTLTHADSSQRYFAGHPAAAAAAA